MDSSESSDTAVHVDSEITESREGLECPSLEGDFSSYLSVSDEGTFLDTSNYGSPVQDNVTTHEVIVNLSIPRDLDSSNKVLSEPDHLTRDQLAELYRPLFVQEEGQCKEVEFIRDEFDLQLTDDFTGDVTSYILSSIGRILCRLLGKNFILLYNSNNTNDDDGDTEMTDTITPVPQLFSNPPSAHLILWATMFNRREQLLELIKTSEYPLGFSLLSAMMYLRLSKMSQREDRQLGTTWKQKSREMQNVAIEIVDKLRNYGREFAIFAIGEKMDLFGTRENSEGPYETLMFSPVDLAQKGQLTDFMASPGVLSYGRRIFMNEIDVGRRHWTFLPICWIPPVPLLLGNPWRLVKYNSGRYLDRPIGKERHVVPDSLLFHVLNRISPLPSAAQNGVWGYKDPCCRSYSKNTNLCTYYSAPINLYQYYLISHACLLLLFTVTLINDMTLEWLVVTWFIAFFLNDIYQMLTSATLNDLHRIPRSTRRSMLRIGDWTILEKESILWDSRFLHVITKWLTTDWNILNAMTYFLFFLGYAFHQDPGSGSGISRALYACSLIVFYLKFMRFFVLWKAFTTNVIRMHLIARKLLPVFFILFLAIIGFGTMYVSLVLPSTNAPQSPERNIYLLFFRPFWYIFGAIHIGDMHTEMKSVARNSCLEEDFNMWDPGSWTGCYTGWLAPMITALFVFLANLILFTYTIGLVSHHYVKTKIKAEKYWAAEQYSLMISCSELPVPPPPLNIICFFFRFILLLIFLVFTLIIRIIRKLKGIYDPEELMLTYPRCFKFHVSLIWMLTWFYRSPGSNYTKWSLRRRQVSSDILRTYDHSSTALGTIPPPSNC